MTGQARHTARRRAAVLVVLVALLVAGGAGLGARQGDPNIFVNVTWKLDKAATEEYGEDYGRTLQEMLENRLFNGLKKAYPCIHYLDQSSLEQMLGVQRMRDLLGGSGEGNLDTIASSVNASHYGNFKIQVVGGTVLISGSMSGRGNAVPIGRSQATAKAGDDNAISSAMDKVVTGLVGSAGGDGPRCGRWQGEISASSAQHLKGKNPSGEPYSSDLDVKISCQIGRTSEDSTSCSVSYTGSLVGKDSSVSTTSSGTATCSAGVSIYKGMAKISLGSCEINTVRQVSAAGQSATSRDTMRIGGWEVEFPVSPDTRTLSGSKKVDDLTTLSWGVSYK